MHDKLKTIFAETFALNGDGFADSLSPDNVPGWDSLGHLKLVAAIQEAFAVELEVDDIMRMENVASIKEVLSSRGVMA
jgi:acyl carrier protein